MKLKVLGLVVLLGCGASNSPGCKKAIKEAEISIQRMRGPLPESGIKWKIKALRINNADRVVKGACVTCGLEKCPEVTE